MTTWNGADPNDIFTPRASRVNAEMYVHREALERELINRLRGTNHIIIYGESGTGKTWLYKRVLSKMRWTVCGMNMAVASRLSDLDKAFSDTTNHRRQGHAKITGYTEETSGSLNAAVFKGSRTYKEDYQFHNMDAFEELLIDIRREAGTAGAVLVLDNLEAILGKTKTHILKQIADVIILLDDERFAAHKVKLLLVGVPDAVNRYFTQLPNLQSVANRLDELPEVARLTESQAKEFVRRGLEEKLGLTFSENNNDDLMTQVGWTTDRIPQYLHEYCLVLAQAAIENDGVIDWALVGVVDRRWLEGSLHESYTVISSSLNVRQVQNPRRSQVVCSLGFCGDYDFHRTAVEEHVRQLFPKSTNSTALNITKCFGELSDTSNGKRPLLVRAPGHKSTLYRFVKPQYRMAIRALLRVEEEKIFRVDRLES